jgi:Mrp family chromosome partitioning ATPase
VKVLAEIPAGPSPQLRAGSLRRSELEAFGGLLERLRGNRVVMMTGKGSSRRRVAVGLATVAASAGTRAALIECELACPGLADELGLANAPGMHEHLRGDATAEAVLQPVVLAGPGSAGASEPLVCVVAGRPTAEAPSLFASDAFGRALAGLRAAYDLVAIDGPGLDQWGALTMAMTHADATVACLDRDDAGLRLPVPVAGVVLQD